MTIYVSPELFWFVAGLLCGVMLLLAVAVLAMRKSKGR